MRSAILLTGLASSVLSVKAVDTLTFSFQGSVYDKATGKALSHAKLEIWGSDSTYDTALTDASGYFQFTTTKRGPCIQENTKYSIRCTKENYLEVTDQITTERASESHTFSRQYYLLPAVQTLHEEVITLVPYGDLFLVPCRVNGLELKFILDTGASDVSISLTEAMFMLKNGHLLEEDIGGTEYFRDATGALNEGTVVTLRQIEFGPVTLRNVKASVTRSLSAPLLLGQSALSQIGPFTLDTKKGTLTIISNR